MYNIRYSVGIVATNCAGEVILTSQSYIMVKLAVYSSIVIIH